MHDVNNNILTPKWGDLESMFTFHDCDAIKQLRDRVGGLITQRNTLSEHLPELSFSSEYGFNLASHVGDDLSAVLLRRNSLAEQFDLPREAAWLTQESSDKILCLDGLDLTQSYTADASFTFEANKLCVVTTADCLAILVTDIHSNFVAAIHAGWQGLHLGIIEKTLKAVRLRAKILNIELGDIVAYMAPHIRQDSYQVDKEFVQKFTDQNPLYKQAFKPIALEKASSLAQINTQEKTIHSSTKTKPGQKFLADLTKIASMQLVSKQVKSILDSGLCSYKNDNFYSYRQATHLQKKSEGRFASMIWIKAS